MATESFVCPACSAESFHPKDVEYGYCGRCHDFTRDPMPSPEFGSDDWNQFAELHNLIATWPRPYPDRRLLFSERDSLTRWLWDQGYRKDKRDHHR